MKVKNVLITSLEAYASKVQEKNATQAVANDMLKRNGYTRMTVQDNAYATHKKSSMCLKFEDPDYDVVFDFPIDKDTLEVLGLGLTELQVVERLTRNKTSSYPSSMFDRVRCGMCDHQVPVSYIQEVYGIKPPALCQSCLVEADVLINSDQS
jgi:hypothetical protein